MRRAPTASKRRLLRAVAVAGAALAPRVTAQLDTQLDALTRELQARAAHVAQEREVLSGRLASARQLLDALFAGERQETKLFAQETRAQLERLRRELHDEMARAAADVQLRVAAAARNVSVLARKRADAQRVHEQQLAALRAEQLAKDVTAAADERVAAKDVNESRSLAPGESPGAPLWERVATGGGWLWSVGAGAVMWAAQALLEAWGRFWRWAVPAVLVLGGALLLAIAVATFVQHRRAQRRARGVIFSGYLKPRTPKQQQQVERRRRRPVVMGVRNAAFPGGTRQVPELSEGAVATPAHQTD